MALDNRRDQSRSQTRLGGLWMSWPSRLANAFRSSRLDRALDQEMQFHIECRIDDLVAAGMTREQARAAAARQFGNRLRVREYSRDVKMLPWLESLLRD